MEADTILIDPMDESEHCAICTQDLRTCDYVGDCRGFRARRDAAKTRLAGKEG